MKRAWGYQTVADQFWTDRKIHSLTPNARLLAIYLLTCENRTSEGFYALRRVVVMDDLPMDAQTLRAAWEELAEADFAYYDESAEAVLISKALKYNAPKSSQQIKGALRKLDAVHDAPGLYERFKAAAERYAPAFHAAIEAHYGPSEEDRLDTESRRYRDN